jgi:hypothetical protein
VTAFPLMAWAAATMATPRISKRTRTSQPQKDLFTSQASIAVAFASSVDPETAARWFERRGVDGFLAACQFGMRPLTLRPQYAGAVRVEFRLRDLLIVVALMGVGAVLWVVLIGPAALVLLRPAS